MGNQCQKFANESNVHGVKEVYNGRGLGRVFWSIIVLIAASLLGVQLKELVTQFIDGETGTKVSYSGVNKFPRLTFCPIEYEDDQAFSRLNMTNASAAVINSLLPFGSITERRQLQRSQVKQEDFDKTEQILMNVYNNSLSQMLLGISMDYERVFSKIEFGPQNLSYTVRRYPTWTGMCYTIETNEQIGSVMGRFGQLFIKMQRRNGNNPMIVVPGGESMAIFPSLDNVFRAGYEYKVGINSLTVKSHNSHQKPCDEGKWKLSNYYSCVLRKAIGQCAGQCVIFIPESDNFPEVRANFSQRCQHDGGILPKGFFCVMDYFERYESKSGNTYDAECLLPCNRRVHQLTLLPFYPSDEFIFNFVIQNAAFSQVIEEFPIYSMTRFICNIGATTSLWFGASMISFVHVLWFLVFGLCARPKVTTTNTVENKSPVIIK